MTQQTNTMRVSLAILGFGLFFAWQNAAVLFLFPSSSGLFVSPLAVSDVSACILLVFCLIAYKQDRDAFSFSWMLGLGALAVVICAVAIVLLSRTLLSLWGVYLGAVVVGFSIAAMAYVWATALSHYSDKSLLWVACGGMLVGSCVDYLLMNGAEMGIPVFVPLCGAGSLVCAAVVMKGERLENSSLLIRPKHPAEFTKLAIGIALFAIALGIVAGTTAEGSTEEKMRVINETVSVFCIAVCMLLVLLLGIHRRSIQTITLIKGFAIVLLAIILLNIVWLDLAPIWLSATLFAWQVLKVLVLLVLVGIHKRRIISLSFIFPAAWAILCTGHAIGVFTGQVLIPLGGTGSQPLMNSVVLLAFMVAVASILLLGNKFVIKATAPQESTRSSEAEQGSPETFAPALQVEQAAEGATSAAAAAEASPDQALTPEPHDPHAARCAELARKYRLTERESEVFRYLAQGHTRASIAKRLFVSENTVREHVKSIYKKLHIHSKQQLIDMVDKQS